MTATASLERAPAPWPQLARHTAPSGNTLPPASADLAAARAYGQRAATTPGLSDRAWEEVAPLLRAGWATYHAEVCPRADRHDWRLSWPAVQEGWTLGHTRPQKEHVP
jgi:hypothetical protein